jgi:hypothetical protein
MHRAPARCPRRAEAGPPPHHARHAPAAARPRPAAARNAPASSATSSVSSTRMATSRSMTRWCASRRISRSAIRWSTGRAISAISTAITPPPMRYTEARMTEVARSCSTASTEDAVDFARPTMARTRSRSCSRPPSRTCWPTARRHRGRHGDLDPAAQRRRALRRRALHLIKHRDATVDEADDLRPGAGFPDRRHHRRDRGPRSSKPTSTGRGGFRVRARWFQIEDQGGAPGSIVVTEIPYRCRSRG